MCLLHSSSKIHSQVNKCLECLVKHWRVIWACTSSIRPESIIGQFFFRGPLTFDSGQYLEIIVPLAFGTWCLYFFSIQTYACIQMFLSGNVPRDRFELNAEVSMFLYTGRARVVCRFMPVCALENVVFYLRTHLSFLLNQSRFQIGIFLYVVCVFHRRHVQFWLDVSVQLGVLKLNKYTFSVVAFVGLVHWVYVKEQPPGQGIVCNVFLVIVGLLSLEAYQTNTFIINDYIGLNGFTKIWLGTVCQK
jgi:hypothetical protein